jgi:transcriptional regulator with GAF, ATPase, and Fis domain
MLVLSTIESSHTSGGHELFRCPRRTRRPSLDQARLLPRAVLIAYFLRMTVVTTRSKPGLSSPRTMSESLEDDKLRRLLDVGRELASEPDSERVLERVLEEARSITGARFAALGVLDVERIELERFLTSGMDADTRRAIGEPPRGRGVLGLLIVDPRPLRLADLGQHPRSYSFPEGHPPMGSFLGVPMLIGGEAWGNLYLTEKQGGGEFTGFDEDAAVLLAQWAATAIENART